ncbi:hypothetical protein CRENBAI_007323 [Crenichthys baileyi]|uniref:Uncharacterized protein n=1 Tax=Crenichthys baileyi TaxID=28760 RepID=A0AAV9S7K2_9TELE
MQWPQTLATYPPGPQPGGDMPQEPRDYPRPTQEQDSHQASNLCPKARVHQKHRMQPLDVTPESHQSPSLMGATAPDTRALSNPNPMTPQMPQTQTLPRISNKAHRTKPKVPHPHYVMEPIKGAQRD